MEHSLSQKIFAKISSPSQFAIDVAIILLLSTITFWLAQKYDAFEYLVEFSRAHEEYEIDEILTLLMIASFAFAAVAYRNGSRLKLEVLKRRKVQQSMKKMAFYDSLTGLPNRELCINRFEHILNQSA